MDPSVVSPAAHAPVARRAAGLVAAAVIVTVMALAASACSGTSSAAKSALPGSPGGAGASGAPTSWPRLPPTTPLPPATLTAPATPTAPTAPPPPPTTTTTLPPRLAVPGPIIPLAAPALPGEGTWAPAGDPLPLGYGVYTTGLRPATGRPAAGLAWIDTAATRVVLYAGSSEPIGTWPQQSAVAAADQPSLMAAFNSGFRIYSYHTGWYDQGRTAEALRPGAASLVIFTDGTATVADWGRDAGPGPTVAAVRQNLTLLVDAGTAVPEAGVPSAWGAVLGGGATTWRSGVGVTAAGDLVYAAGFDLDPASLARLLVAAGAVRAMQLDINPQWVSFATFTHTGGIGGAAITGTDLVSGMHYLPDHYLQTASRDFFAVFTR